MNISKKKILFLGTKMQLAGAQKMQLVQSEWFHIKGYRVSSVFLYDNENLKELWTSNFPFEVVNIKCGLNRETYLAKSQNFYEEFFVYTVFFLDAVLISSKPFPMIAI